MISQQLPGRRWEKLQFIATALAQQYFLVHSRYGLLPFIAGINRIHLSYGPIDSVPVYYLHAQAQYSSVCQKTALSSKRHISVLPTCQIWNIARGRDPLHSNVLAQELHN